MNSLNLTRGSGLDFEHLDCHQQRVTGRKQVGVDLHGCWVRSSPTHWVKTRWTRPYVCQGKTIRYTRRHDCGEPQSHNDLVVNATRTKQPVNSGGVWAAEDARSHLQSMPNTRSSSSRTTSWSKSHRSRSHLASGDDLKASASARDVDFFSQKVRRPS
jgi:hypothetical protein